MDSNRKPQANYGESLLRAGLSIIPVKDKLPLVAWAQFQKRRAHIGELPLNGSLALVCGPVSGGVEAIDIDTKHYEGPGDLHKRLQSAIRKSCVGLWEKFVIQKTISNGYHLIYRCKEVGKNNILAKNADGKPIIETRGKGGYIVIADTPGYVLRQGELIKIPSITTEQRTKLFEICKSFNDGHTVERPNGAANFQQSEAKELEKLDAYIDALGKKDITANYEDWMTIIFALSHEFGEQGRSRMHKLSRNYNGYDPAECDNKYSDCLKRPTPAKPKTIASVYKLICNNLSKVKLKRLTEAYDEKVSDNEQPVLYDDKRGWHFNPNAAVIARWMVKKGFRRFANDQGYSWLMLEDNQCEMLPTKHAADLFNRLLLKEFPGATALVHANQVMKYEVSALIPTIKQFHRDTAHQKFLYFKNCVVAIDKRSYRILKWDKIDLPVWKKNVKPFEFTDPGKTWKRRCLFAHLIKNLQNPEIQTPDYFMRVMGYCAHNYKRADDDQIVVIMGNQKVKHSDNKGAGSGKTLLATSFQHITNQIFIPGDTIDFHDKFAFQNVEPDTENILIDDYTGKLTHLKTVATSAMKVEKKNQPSFTIPKPQVPKIIITLPEVPDITDEGIRRRLYPIVISDHYYLKMQAGDLSPIVTTHGKRFFEEFDANDWNGYFRFLIECCMLYLRKRPDPKPVQTILFERLAHQSIEDDELVEVIENLPVGKIILIDNYYEKYKQDGQVLLSFSKLFRKVLKTLNYKYTEPRVPVAREGNTPLPGKVDNRLWTIVTKPQADKFGTGIIIPQK